MSTTYAPHGTDPFTGERIAGYATCATVLCPDCLDTRRHYRVIARPVTTVGSRTRCAECGRHIRSVGLER